jgi:hypothetical protein
MTRAVKRDLNATIKKPLTFGYLYLVYHAHEEVEIGGVMLRGTNIPVLPNLEYGNVR